MEKFIELLEQLCNTLSRLGEAVDVSNERLQNLTSNYKSLREDVDKLIENNERSKK